MESSGIIRKKSNTKKNTGSWRSRYVRLKLITTAKTLLNQDVGNNYNRQYRNRNSGLR
jgi:hypothetical protein